MSIRSDSAVREEARAGAQVLVIDFYYRDQEGRRRRYRRDASVQMKTAAKAEAKRLKELAATTGSLETVCVAPTFARFVEGTFEELFMPRFKPATQVRYRALFRQSVLAFFGGKALDEIDATDLRAYEAQLLARGVKPRGPVGLVRTVLKAAVAANALDGLPPLPKLPKPSGKLPEAPSPEEVRVLYERAGGWLKLAIALASLAGLRSGEVRALEVRDIDLSMNRILVRRAFSENTEALTKSCNDRVVPIADDLRPLLVAAIASKKPRDRLVLSMKGATPTRQHILTRLNQLEDRCGARRWSFHALRHAFCSTLVSRGASVEAVRVLAGHGDLKTTMRYVHATGADLANAIARLGNG